MTKTDILNQRYQVYSRKSNPLGGARRGSRGYPGIRISAHSYIRAYPEGGSAGSATGGGWAADVTAHSNHVLLHFGFRAYDWTYCTSFVVYMSVSFGLGLRGQFFITFILLNFVMHLVAPQKNKKAFSLF